MTTPAQTPALLDESARHQRDYDQAAATWQRLHFRWRIAVLVLGVFTALFGVLSRTSFGTESLGSVLPYFLFGLPAVVVLLVAVLYAVNPGQRWVAYRAGSETLKTEAFLYATAAEKYADRPAAERDALFGQRVGDIAGLVTSLQPRGVFARLAAAWRSWREKPPAPLGRIDAPMMPGAALDPATYIDLRLLPQRDWYDSRGRGHRATQGWLSAGIVGFNVVAGLLVVAGAPEWIPLATTLVGALATYSALSNAEFLANSYRQTVLQLDQLRAAWQRGDYGPDGFAQFVLHVEQVIAREYTGWVRPEAGEAGK